ncbi:MAG: alpha,alpha-trehalase TreF [Flavisolibacter sp.]
MKKILLLFLLVANLAQAQLTPTPDILWGQLFKDVQLSHALGDNKTFVDCLPKYEPSVILKKYAEQKNKSGFDLKSFVTENFIVPSPPNVKVTPGLSLKDHLAELWNVLSRKKDSVRKWSSLLPLPDSYIVPGGRFREIYYWDSYFTMQGLAVSGRYDLIEDMVDNFAYLIMHYGHIPNGNRNYYLGRSQPPYFALMVQLLQEHSGNAYRKFFPAMEKEYAFWMTGTEKLKTVRAYRRLVKMPDGSILNRNWDDVNLPRQESYAEDVATSKIYRNGDGMVYRNLRGGAESGIDFSSRWFRDTLHLNTIETSNLIPVDLNSLLYAYETILSKAAKAIGAVSKEKLYAQKAQKRKAAVLKYCWDKNKQYFFDFDFTKNKTSGRWHIIGDIPLFCGLATTEQAESVRKTIEEKFLKDGGAVTSLYNTGEQWDAPNGWAPLEFITVKGLMDYRFEDLAKKIAERWMGVNERVFSSTGKMLEKYNVEDIHLESGGGEYPTQDGFGWTNGVYLAFDKMFRTK